MTIHEHLLSVGGRWKACKEAREWAAQYQTAQEVWDNCPRVDWLFWWAARMGQHQAIARVAKDIADSVKHLRGDYTAYTAYDAAAYAAAYAATYAAAYAVADADADTNAFAADAAADAAAYAIDAAAYAATAAAYADATAAAYADAYADAARSKQQSLNMEIARQHLICPWHES